MTGLVKKFYILLRLKKNNWYYNYLLYCMHNVGMDIHGDSSKLSFAFERGYTHKVARDSLLMNLVFKLNGYKWALKYMGKKINLAIYIKVYKLWLWCLMYKGGYVRVGYKYLDYFGALRFRMKSNAFVEKIYK